nr:MAG TPA: hypothetical protein [Caudoviricetes sp.]
MLRVKSGIKLIDLSVHVAENNSLSCLLIAKAVLGSASLPSSFDQSICFSILAMNLTRL